MLSKAQSQELISLNSLLYASAIGLTAGMTATMFYSLGSFIPSLQAEFGWSRGDISLGATFLTLAVFFTGTLAGQLCDRFGAATIALISLLSYAFSVVLLALFMRNLYHFWIGYFLIAAVGVGSTPIVLVRPITTEFQAARGVALGIALTGAGLAGFWVPRLVTQVIASHGWREAYLSMALIAALVAPIVWYGFSRTPSLTPANSPQHIPTGMTHKSARATWSYWGLSVMAFAMAAGIAGIIVHLVPLFIDYGAGPVEAAKTASMVGIASVVGRLIIGYLLDYLPTIAVTTAILLLTSLGIFLLWAFGLQFSYASVILLGLAAGAEIDLLAYLTVSYFGRRNYGAIYGWQYSIFALGYGLSPYVIGRLYDASGSYAAPLMFSGALVIVAAFSCLLLPRLASEQSQ